MVADCGKLPGKGGRIIEHSRSSDLDGISEMFCQLLRSLVLMENVHGILGFLGIGTSASARHLLCFLHCPFSMKDFT